MQPSLNFLDAESKALNMAYAEFFGENEPVGIAFTFLNDRKAGYEWADVEKEFAKSISQQSITDLKNRNLYCMIVAGLVPDCTMSRRFMATGSGFTSKGYNN